jgi:hypothetical protein
MDYSLCDVTFRLVCAPASRMPGVARILESLFVLTGPHHTAHRIDLIVNDAPETEVSGEVVFDAPGLTAIKTPRGYHLRADASFLAIDLPAGRAVGSLSDSFMYTPLEEQRGLFLFALLMLLSRHGLYPLHAAGVWHAGCGFLLVGNSGSGKTSVTGALTRSGWHYLSDDSVLLRCGSQGVEAWAFGRQFHCAPAMLRHFPELARHLRSPVIGKRLVDVSSVYPGQFRSRFRPRVILFPEITPEPESCLIPLDSTATLVRLLGQGTGLLHSRESTAAQTAVLNHLARSAHGFRLLHGADVHRNPAHLAALLQRIANPGQDPEEQNHDQGDPIYAMHSAG